jgi:hypothetical protein
MHVLMFIRHTHTCPGVQMEHGLQKYVLIKATDASNTDKYLVRGKCSAEYHRDAAQATVMGLSQAGVFATHAGVCV